MASKLTLEMRITPNIQLQAIGKNLLKRWVALLCGGFAPRSPQDFKLCPGKNHSAIKKQIT